MMPTVSIVIPVYKAEATLRRCVESLAGGTYPHVEILLVEDCSPDNSWQICQELAAQYPCVRIFRNQSNSGPSVTRNRGLEEMTGDYLMFVDSDDWVEPNFVESFVTFSQKIEPSLVVCSYWNHDEFLNQSATVQFPDLTDAYATLELKDTLIPLYHAGLLLQIWNKLFIADIIRTNQIRFDPSIRIGEDFRFLLSYLEHFPSRKLTLIHQPLYHYIRCSKDSLMFHMDATNFSDNMVNLERLYIFLGIPQQQRQAMLAQNKTDSLNNWAYMIMHSPSMSMKEKKRQILMLDAQRGKKLYRDARILYWKEKAFQILKRLHLR